MSEEVATAKAVVRKYKVESVEETDTPSGMPKDTWFKYVIGQGSSKIEGMKSGTLKAVTEHAASVAEDLNSRATGGNSTYAARKRK